MKRIILTAALVALMSPVLAQSTAETQSNSRAETAIQNVGSPIINNNSAPVTDATIRQHGLPVSSPGTVIPSGASADTCERAGLGASVVGRAFGISVAGGAETSDACEARTDARTLSATAQDSVTVTMRLCQTPAIAEAFEDAADLRDRVVSQMAPAVRTNQAVSFRCPDRLRPQWARDREAGKAQAALEDRRVTVFNTSDPFIRERLERTGRR